MAPIGIIQETHKKNWNKWRRGDNRQKTTFLLTFFPKIMKIPKRKIRLMKKKKTQKIMCFGHFWKIWQNRIFHWEWANRREKIMKLPIGFFISLINWKNGRFLFFGFIRTCHIPIGRESAKNWNIGKNYIKWRIEKKCHNSNDFQSILDEKNCIRILSTRSVVLDRFQSVLSVFQKNKV